MQVFLNKFIQESNRDCAVEKRFGFQCPDSSLKTKSGLVEIPIEIVPSLSFFTKKDFFLALLFPLPFLTLGIRPKGGESKELVLNYNLINAKDWLPWQKRARQNVKKNVKWKQKLFGQWKDLNKEVSVERRQKAAPKKKKKKKQKIKSWRNVLMHLHSIFFTWRL